MSAAGGVTLGSRWRHLASGVAGEVVAVSGGAPGSVTLRRLEREPLELRIAPGDLLRAFVRLDDEPPAERL